MMKTWNEESLESTELGSTEYFKAQSKVIKSKKYVKKNYDLWYEHIKNEIKSIPNNGLVVELGSGGGYLKEFVSEIITSDINGGHVDMIVDAQEMPFENNSVKALVLTHSFHHFPNPEQFFQEANRVLIPGGKIIFIEVTSTPFSKLVFNIAGDEPIDTSQKGWSFKQNNSMSDANQALSWIIFNRDIKLFYSKYPFFKVTKQQYLPWCTYLLSGGVTRKPFIPGFLFPLAVIVDYLTFLYPFFAIHWTITIRKEHENPKTK
jgi:SAM-dependent methyltransferase